MNHRAVFSRLVIIMMAMLILFSSLPSVVEAIPLTTYTIQSYSNTLRKQMAMCQIYSTEWVFAGEISTGGLILWVKSVSASGVMSATNDSVDYVTSSFATNPVLVSLTGGYFLLLYRTSTSNTHAWISHIATNGYLYSPSYSADIGLSTYRVFDGGHYDSASGIVTFSVDDLVGRVYVVTVYFNQATHGLDLTYGGCGATEIRPAKDTYPQNKSGIGSLCYLPLSSVNYAFVMSYYTKHGAGPSYYNISACSLKVSTTGTLSIVSSLSTDVVGYSDIAYANATTPLTIARGYAGNIFMIYAEESPSHNIPFLSFHVQNASGNIYYDSTLASVALPSSCGDIIAVDAGMVTACIDDGSKKPYLHNISMNGVGTMTDSGVSFPLSASGTFYASYYSIIARLQNGYYGIAKPLNSGTTMAFLSVGGFPSSFTGFYATGGGGAPVFTPVDFSKYDYIGPGFGSTSGSIAILGPYLEMRASNYLTTTYKGLELLVDADQNAIDSDPSNYLLYIGPTFTASASYIGSYDSSYDYIQWNFSVGVVAYPGSRGPLIQISHLIPGTGSLAGVYWLPVNGVDTSGSFSDAGYSIPNTINNTYDPKTDLDYLGGFCWRLYYSSVSPGTPVSNLTNGVTLLGFQNHPTYNVPYCYVGDTPNFDVTVNNTNSYYTLQLYKGTSVNGSFMGFPYTLTKADTVIPFEALYQGNYTVKLLHSSTVLISRQFNVTNSSVNTFLWTSPNPSDVGASYKVYIYLRSLKYLQYYLMRFYSYADTTVTSKANTVVRADVSALNAWHTTVSPSTVTSEYEYWLLFGTNNNVTFIPVTSPCPHRFYITTFDSLNTNTSGTTYPDTLFRIYGTHTHPFSDVALFVGSTPVADPIQNMNFSYLYSIHGKNVYVIALKININGSWTTLKSLILHVIDRPVNHPESDPIALLARFLRGLIPKELYILIAIGIIIALSMAPIGVIAGISEVAKVQISVPALPLTISCVFCACAGWWLTIYWGLLPWVSFFMVIFVLVVVMAFMWIRGEKKE